MTRQRELDCKDLIYEKPEISFLPEEISTHFGRLQISIHKNTHDYNVSTF